MMTTSIKVISDGVIKRDGGAMFGQVPKVSWENTVATDRRNRMTLGLNCLLMELGGKLILVDTGVGTKEIEGGRDEYGLVPSRLTKALKALGKSSRDVAAVVLTHLHFDHSGGCTKLDRTGTLVPTFSRATYYVQRRCWEEACSPNERCQDSYNSDDFEPVEERGQLELLDGDVQIMPGLSVLVTNGHARGHQVVLISQGGERVAFLGDLVPTVHHLNLASIQAFDQFPEETLEMKRELLCRAEREGWLLVFYHGHEYSAGYVERRSGKTYLRPVAL